MPEVQEIPDEEYEQALERVAAIDVAKMSGMVCTRLPRQGGKPGARVSRVWEVPATTRAVVELAVQLVELGIQKITVESTSVIWGPPGTVRDGGQEAVSGVAASLADTLSGVSAQQSVVAAKRGLHLVNAGPPCVFACRATRIVRMDGNDGTQGS